MPKGTLLNIWMVGAVVGGLTLLAATLFALGGGVSLTAGDVEMRVELTAGEGHGAEIRPPRALAAPPERPQQLARRAHGLQRRIGRGGRSAEELGRQDRPGPRRPGEAPASKPGRHV